MSRYFQILGLLACSSVLYLGPAVAAPSDTGLRDSSQTMFIDLTKGDAPIAMPDRLYPTATSPRVRHIDLSDGKPGKWPL